MKLFRVRFTFNWSFVLARNEEYALAMILEDVGYKVPDDLPFEEDVTIVEYSLDEPMILPSGWQSEAKKKDIPLATLDVMEHNARHTE